MTAPAAAALAEMLADPMLADDLAVRLTCGEAERFAAFLIEAGRPEVAAEWIARHAETDEEGDAHYGQEVAQ